MKVLLTTIPKAGTHFLAPVLRDALKTAAIPLEKQSFAPTGLASKMSEGSLFYGHLRANYATYLPPQTTVIVLLRDPRDILVSLREYLLFRSEVPDHRGVRAHLQGQSPDKQYRALIDGISAGPLTKSPALVKHCGGFLEWQNEGATILRFEDLFTDHAAARIAETLVPWGVTEAGAMEAIKRYRLRPSPSLNVGLPGRWRTELSEAILEYLMKNTPPGWLSELGYG